MPLEEKTILFNRFLELPVECQIAIVQAIDDDITLCSFLSVNRDTFCLFQNNKNLIFQTRISNNLTSQPIQMAFAVYRDYFINQKRTAPFIKEVAEGHNTLSYLVFKGYEKAVSAYLKTMSSRDELLYKVRHDYNLVHLAILSKNPKMVDLILAQPESNEQINATNAYRDKAIHFAARTGCRFILKSIVEHVHFDKKSINEKAEHAYSPLANYCKYGDSDDVEFVQNLIRYGARINESEFSNSAVDSNETWCVNGIPASIAIKNSKPRIAQFLLERIKDDIKKYVVCPNHILGYAIEYGYTDIVRLLANDCRIGIDRTVSFDSSKLSNILHLADIELMQIVFKLESSLYLSHSHQEEGEYIMPKFEDYMLTAMRSLFKISATSKTLAIYNQLIQFGFTISMTSRDGSNVFHALARSIIPFCGSKESSVYAQPIINDLLCKDVALNYKSRANGHNLTPMMCFENYNDCDKVISFEEELTKCTSSIAEMQCNVITSNVSDEYRPGAHDDSNRNGCNFM